MNFGIRNKDLSFLFVAFLAIASIDFWSYRGIDQFTYNAIEAFILLMLVIITVTKSGVFFRRGLQFKGIAVLFLLIPIPSMFGAALYHNQEISESLYVNRYSLYWLFYFVLHIFNLSREKIVKLMIFIGTVWAGLTIVQQFTYPTYFFYSRNDEKKSILRAGVYRYMLAGTQFGLFLLLHFYYKYLTEKRVKFIALTLFGLAGFYYYGTRQTALAAAACMCISALLLEGMAKWKNLILVTGLILLVLGVKEVLFAEYIEMTSSQLDNTDDIRMLAGRFFLNDYWPSDWAKVLGNGKPYPYNAYGQEMELIKDGLHFFRSDVGIIGAYNIYGIFYVLLVLGILFKTITMRFRDIDNRYLKLFFINTGLMLILNESFSSSGAIPFYCMVLYLMDKAKAAELTELQLENIAEQEQKESFSLVPA